jgi:6-phosphofructokinase 1
MEASKSFDKQIKKIGVFTSGGDSPGMNAAIRAVVRAANHYNLEVIGFFNGYDGLIQNDHKVLTSRTVAHILQNGGTFLKSARSNAFRTTEGRKQAFENLKTLEIDALIAIGGDGTLTGLKFFQQEFGIPGIGIPGTIDNDLYGTDYTLGFDTAVNTVVECIDKIRDTANSHNRLFFIEVMGRDSGFIALNSAIASGAFAVMLPETDISLDALIALLQNNRMKGKQSSIVIVAEGNTNGNASDIAKALENKHPDYACRVTILGHLQRGGKPSYFDRQLAARFGVKAVESLLDGATNVMVGIQKNKMVLVPVEKATKMHPDIDRELLRISSILSE